MCVDICNLQTNDNVRQKLGKNKMTIWRNWLIRELDDGFCLNLALSNWRNHRNLIDSTLRNKVKKFNLFIINQKNLQIQLFLFVVFFLS